MLETFLNPFGSAMDTIVAMTNDTDDSLEIELNGTSVWPNGGGDWRDIGKGSTKNVGVSRVLPRTAGVNVHLIEYDCASADDNLGNLKFDTAGLRKGEGHTEALVHSGSEGSLYGVTFTVAPVSLDPSQQEVEAPIAINACLNLEQKLYKIQRKVDIAYETLEKYVAVPQLILARYGVEGLTAYNNARAYHLTEKVCPDDSADYGKLLAGDWRLGEFDNLASEKLQPTKSTLTFSADGTLLGSGEGTWEKVPNKCELKIDRFSYDKRMFVQSEGDGVTLYTDTDHHLVNNVMRFARWKYADTDYTDENGVLHVAKPEGIDGGGRGDWLEKIETNPLPASIVNSNDKNARAALFGHWKIKIPSPRRGWRTMTRDKRSGRSLPTRFLSPAYRMRNGARTVLCRNPTRSPAVGNIWGTGGSR
ncbi:hypothetical protein OEG84_05695 [Hoeflea sp. G2-23]|uniref:Uncharacterized protein n=1 Tax=Hoeflea algicola TaxID=2983763 RepID=A0ABT3Z617_9HYPH|nr:hypothetical protein [Hoeflea algicola]MCY0147217.1 hypothetical protein [Hoeflea algicola]